MENLLLRRGDSSISLGQRRPAHCNPAVQRAQLGTLTRAFLQVLCATRSCSAKKQFDNQKQLKGSARARAREQQAATWKRSKRMFYVYEYATGDTARCFQEERDRGA
jgi:hypothetical protein